MCQKKNKILKKFQITKTKKFFYATSRTESKTSHLYTDTLSTRSIACTVVSMMYNAQTCFDTLGAF